MSRFYSPLHREYGTTDRTSLGTSPVLDDCKNSPQRLARRTEFLRFQETVEGEEVVTRQKCTKKVVQLAEEERAARIEQLNYYAELRSKKDEFEVVFTRRDLDLKLGINEFGHCCVTKELKKKGRSQGNVPTISVGTVLVAINEQVNNSNNTVE